MNRCIHWTVSLLSSLAIASAGVAHPRSFAGDEPERRAPAAAAPALKPFAWTSKNALRFIWWLPKDYDPKVPRNMTVILHGTGLDYRWGLWNNKPGIMRPDDVVISVDGPSPDGQSRLFLGEKKLEETNPAVLARLLYAEQHEEVGEAVLAHHSVGEPPIIRERLDGVLG